MRARFLSLGFFKQIPLLYSPLATRLGSVLLGSLLVGFRKLLAPLSRVPLVGLSLGSLALRSFRFSPALFTTTASADSCRALAPQLSPSKVFNVSTRVAGLYLLRLSVTVGFRGFQHTYRPQAASLPVRVPTIVSLLNASFGSEPRGPVPCFSLRLLSRLPVNSFLLTTLNPCRAHWIDRPGRWGESAERVWRADPFSWKLKPR